MKTFTKISALLLAVVAVFHLLCVIFDIEVIVDQMSMPMWVSTAGFIIPAILSIGLWKESKR